MTRLVGTGRTPAWASTCRAALDAVTKYDRYACTQCAGTGERRNESQNIVDPRATVLCFCSGLGEVWVLKGFDAPWYAGGLIEAEP